MKFRDLWGRRGWTQHLEFLRPGSSGLGGSDVIAAEMEQVVDLIGAERKGCAWPADLNRFICRADASVGARLLNPFVLAMLDAGHGLPLRRAVDEQACRRSCRCDRDPGLYYFEIHPLLADEFVRRGAMSGGLVLCLP